MRFLPILIPTTDPNYDGVTGEKRVKVVHHDIIDLLIANPGAFNKKYGNDIPEKEQRRLRGYWHIIDAARGSKRRKLHDVALSFAQLERSPKLVDLIVGDPLNTVQEYLTRDVGSVSLVLWQIRTSGILNVGVNCDGGLLDALYVLMLFRIGVSASIGIGSCVICGTTFERERGDRKKTCSAKCRKQASRLKNKPAAATVG